MKGVIDLKTALPNLANNISIQGPGAANLTIQRDPTAVPFSVFTVDSGETVQISGVTISGGDHGGGLAGDYGGGIDNLGTLTVRNSVFSGNTASGGGGIYNGNDSTLVGLTVVDSIFTNNTSNGGGGIGSIGTTIVDNSVFVGNSSVAYNTGSELAGGGGGIGSGGNALTVNSSEFINNSAASGGGAIGSSGPLSVLGSTFINNTSPVQGGGIEDFSDFPVTVRDCDFVGNSAAYGGGIWYVSGPAGYGAPGGTLTVYDSLFLGNTAPVNSFGNGGQGGGIWSDGATTVTDSFFALNTAVYGGAIYNYGPGQYNGDTLTITDSILFFNSATDGGGIYNTGTLINTGNRFSNNIGGNLN